MNGNHGDVRGGDTEEIGCGWFNTMFYLLLHYFSERKAVGASGSWSELGEKRNAIKPFSFKYMPGK